MERKRLPCRDVRKGGRQEGREWRDRGKGNEVQVKEWRAGTARENET